MNNFQISAGRDSLISSPIIGQKVRIIGDHSESTRSIAHKLQQSLTSYFENKGIKTEVRVNVSFKEGQPVLSVAAYSSGEFLVSKAENEIKNLLDGVSIDTSFEDHRAEIILRE